MVFSAPDSIVFMEYCVDAALEVEFVATSKEKKVAGRVMAYYGKNFDYGCPPAKKDLYNAMIFETKPHVYFKSGKINLMRSVFAVPAKFSLVIDANLRDFTSGDIVLSGTYEFLVPRDGSSSIGSIVSNDCSLNLKVDWKLPCGA
ncbi:hypothetical protein CTI12_AA149420 [Artemisia annua]|uniref:Uncharacterized protein n=1 Tax=Artemisia annua TaxID=35608 RepID=A0A2U1NF25_ARTAN|nr:hypothetical protein CTI12_AA149420 [Artemisia annua]